jgi:hypothetical protein
MATTITKLFPTGILQTSVELNEVLYSSIKVSPTGVYAAQFDEVSLSTSTAERKTSTGIYRVSGYFDEYTLAPINPVTDGLQVNLLSAPSSGTTWTDASGNGRNATLQGSASYISDNGGGVKLNNNNSAGTDYISVPYNITTNTFTVEVVASFNPTSYWATIWGNDNYNSSAGFYAYMGSATNINWGKVPGSSVATITASNNIRHWIFVNNNTSTLLYLNGSQLGSTTVVTTQTSFASSEFYFGARHQNNGVGPTDRMNNSTASLHPVYYQMRIYNKALSPSEVTQNYNSVKSTYGI